MFVVQARSELLFSARQNLIKLESCLSIRINLVNRVINRERARFYLVVD